jgi:Tol biopolymer transport system component
LNLAAEAKKDETVAYLKSLGADQRPPIFPELRGDYMGQPKPRKKAVPFAPGILNPRHEYHGAVTVTPDGKEIHWSAYADSGGASIWRSRQVEGRWTEPEFFQRGDVPFISPRGDQFYFVAFKQVQGGKKAVIYIRDKTASGWSEPRELPETINSTPGIHWQISVDRQGNLYFGASGGTSSRIYVSESTGGEYGKPQLIESLKDREAFSPFIAPDGSYLIFTTPEEGENLFLSFKKKDGTWSRGIDLSNVIGVKGAFCPMVTHDGKFLFFVCGVDGKYAHYWADASFIEELRKTETERN